MENYGYDEDRQSSGSPPLSGTASTASVADNDNEAPRPRPVRKLTAEAKISEMEKRRTDHLKRCRQIAESHATDGPLMQLDNLMRDQNFCNSFFGLFDRDGKNEIDQKELFEMLKLNASGSRLDHTSIQARLDTILLVETAAYIMCEEKPIDPVVFQRIMTSRNVPSRIFRMADSNNDGQLLVDELMAFLITISMPRHKEDFSPEQVKILEDIFRENLPYNKTELSLQEFKKIMPSKNAFFVERVFKIFDKDGNNKISLAEFLDTMYQYAAHQTNSEKVLFLFKVYDIDGDDSLQLEELERVMGECLRESGLELPEIDVQALALALYEDALGDDVDTGEINIDQLRNALEKHDGLLENLTMSLAKWMVPQQPRPKESAFKSVTAHFKKKFSARHFQNQKQLYLFIGAIVIVNAALFIARALHFKGFSNLDGSFPNPYYMLSRANGRVLLFNSSLILVLVHRYTVTKLRELGFGFFLPLDHNIYIHKFLGVLIFVQSWFHTIMHICNFSINVAPDPVKFVQINDEYWDVYKHNENDKNWIHLGYELPGGCDIVPEPDLCDLTNDTRITHCQICENGTAWDAGEWLFTLKPGVFGLVGGLANPSGFALMAICTIMTICSMPFVRKGGNFEVFYFTHLLYVPYYVLLILHAPDFWKWAIGPLFLYVIERLYRFLSLFVGHGYSHIVDADVLPSRVTNLVIQRPDGFKFCPGDWVFVCIPKIARHEWHPFTISSAPEQRENFTLHIRGVGQWTNRLYAYVEEKKRVEGIQSRQASRKSKKGSVHARRRQRIAEERAKQQAEGVIYDDGQERFQLKIVKKDEKVEKLKKEQPLEVYIDGPFGAPASNIFRAEHAVLIATGIGVTPFSSILQSIMHRYFAERRECPRCHHRWSDDFSDTMINLKKVDFIWINRDQKSFEWFLELLGDMESAQIEEGGGMDKLLDFHLYFTAALARTDMRAVGLQLAMDLIHRKEQKDMMTGLKARTNAGRPNWDRIFTQLRDKRHGKITVFYCGNPMLASNLREKCEDFGFDFRKEVF